MLAAVLTACNMAEPTPRAAGAAPAAPLAQTQPAAQAATTAQAPQATPAPAASPGGFGRGGPGNVEASVVRGVISPEVSADHRVTFRLQAPNAHQAQLQGDFTIRLRFAHALATRYNALPQA
jgi:hypothetical protein